MDINSTNITYRNGKRKNAYRSRKIVIYKDL